MWGGGTFLHGLDYKRSTLEEFNTGVDSSVQTCKHCRGFSVSNPSHRIDADLWHLQFYDLSQNRDKPFVVLSRCTVPLYCPVVLSRCTVPLYCPV